jgi:heavy metal sensor kinase
VSLHSFRFKLSLINGLLISIVFLGLGYARYEIASTRARSRFHDTLQRDAEFFSSHLRYGRRGFYWSRRGMEPHTAMGLEQLRPHYFITSAEGKLHREELYSGYMLELLSGYVLDRVRMKRSGFEHMLTADGEEYCFVSHTIPAEVEGGPYILHIGRSLESLNSALDEILMMYVMFVPVMLIISGGVGWFLASRALKPFEEIALTARKIDQDNLSTQIITHYKEPELQELVHAFNAMVRRLNRSFEQMRKFNADVAHELRTPIAVMRGENEIALQIPNLSHEVRNLLASNLEELERLTRLVNELLTLSEAEAGTKALVKERINLKSLVEDLVEHMKLPASDRKVHIEFLESVDAPLQGDEIWLRRAVLNLLDNAIKYSSAGGRIEVGLRTENGRVRLGIRDEGIGIGEADLPRIFDRLYRADPARSRADGGTGLGLSLVHWVVEAHGGTIQVTSKLNEGSSFEIQFPLSPN